MKKLKTLLTMSAAVLMLASCGDNKNSSDPSYSGKEIKITKEQALEKIGTAADSMRNSAGLKVVESLDLGLNISQKELSVDEIPVVMSEEKTIIDLTTETNLEIMAGEDSENILLESQIEYSKAYGEDENSAITFEGMFGLYVKDEALYTQVEGSQTKDGVEESISNKNGITFEQLEITIEAYIEQLMGRIGEMDGDIPEFDESMMLMIQVLLAEVEDALPGPKAYKDNKDLTIVYSYTMDDINNAIDIIVPLVLGVQTSVSPAIAMIDAMPNEDGLEQMAELIKAQVAEMFMLNEFTLSVTIHDEKFISAMSFDLDLDLKNLAYGGTAGLEGQISKYYLYAGIDVHSNVAIEALPKNHIVEFPVDMGESWMKSDIE